MDITPQDNAQQSISDDQELAKALAGVVPDAAEPAPLPTPTATDAPANDSATTDNAPAQPPPAETPSLDYEETPSGVSPAAVASPDSAPETASEPSPSNELPQPGTVTTDNSFANNSLESIKKDALNELRPLMDTVELPPEEKFDTYLMLLRSTDDESLIGPAHTAALAIEDEKRKATALLDVIKEIDYLSQQSKTAQPKQS